MIGIGRRTAAIGVGIFVLLPILELTLLILIGRQLGALPVLAYVIVLGLVGGWLIRRRWRNAWRSLQEAATVGGMPAQKPGQSLTDAIDTALVVTGGIALIFPGVLTDVFGLLCLLPITRALPRRLVTWLLDRKLPGFTDLAAMTHDVGSGPARGRQGDVIPGEVVEEDSTRRDPGPPPEQVIIRGQLDT